jgi:hypothetical protein
MCKQASSPRVSVVSAFFMIQIRFFQRGLIQNYNAQNQRNIPTSSLRKVQCDVLIFLPNKSTFPGVDDMNK